MQKQTPEGQGRLVEKVIQQGICVQCGACVGLCPYFQFFDGRVVVTDPCNSETWRCLQVCPRADYQDTAPGGDATESAEIAGVGDFQSVCIARAADNEIRRPAQYGGVVTGLLLFAIQEGYIKAAVLTDAGNDLSPGGTLARDRSAVLQCAGSRYSAAGGLSALNKALKNGEDQLAVVGLPCQMEALDRMTRMQPDGQERSRRIELKIGLFCTWAVDHRALRKFLQDQGISGNIKKFDIPPPPAEIFQVFIDEERLDFPLADIRPYVQQGCSLCDDMTALRADIAVGTVEGREGWNTVLVRTDSGAELFKAAVEAGRIETEQLADENFNHLQAAAGNKQERARQARKEMNRGGA